jgi:hypothetical protein
LRLKYLKTELLNKQIFTQKEIYYINKFGSDFNVAKKLQKNYFINYQITIIDGIKTYNDDYLMIVSDLIDKSVILNCNYCHKKCKNERCLQLQTTLFCYKAKACNICHLKKSDRHVTRTIKIVQ